MTEINRTFKYYLKPTKLQKDKLDRILKICCWLHNFLLRQFRNRDKNKEKQFTERELQDSLPKLKKEYPFLKQVHSTSLQDVAKRVYKIWDHNEELKLSDPKKKYPNFKQHHRYNSFTYYQPIIKVGCGYKIDNSPLSKKKEMGKLRLSLGRQNNHNVQMSIKITMTRELQGDCKTLTIKRKNNRYYASFSCENIPLNILPATDKTIGADMNLKKDSYITLSDGTKYEHPQYYKKSEKELITASRSLNNKTKGSRNWKDAKLQLAKKWEKVVNQSKHYSYQVANKLVKEYDVIKIENLKIKNMVKNRCLSKAIQQARWGIQKKAIADRTEIVGRQLILVSPRNTTQKCSRCSELADPKLTLKDRIFRCWNPFCYLELDRDVNSAINIRNSEARLEPVLEKSGKKWATPLYKTGRRYFVSW